MMMQIAEELQTRKLKVQSNITSPNKASKGTYVTSEKRYISEIATSVCPAHPCEDPTLRGIHLRFVAHGLLKGEGTFYVW